MDELLKQVILGFPSFTGLLLMLYWQREQIKSQDKRFDSLLERLEECQRQLQAQEETD